MVAQPVFDSSHFESQRVTLPEIQMAHTLTKVTDVVIGVVQVDSAPTLIGGLRELEKKAHKMGGTLLELLVGLGATGSADEVTVLTLPGIQVVAIGLGSDLDYQPEDLRRAAGVGTRHIVHMVTPQPHRIAISLDVTTQTEVQAVAEGALLAADHFQKLSRKSSSANLSWISIIGSAKLAGPALKTAKIVADAVSVARDWTNMPPNLLGPSDLAEQARGYLKDTKVSVDVLDEGALARAGYGGILAVGGGSARPPQLLRLDWRPRGAQKHLALVGKGITYDSGGYNLKTADGLKIMKYNMAGAADVIAAIHAVAQLGLRIHVTGYLPLAESMISGSAYRPGDVISMFDGTTVENMDSDAEGRLILADALARARADEPDLIVDIATLTGACAVALGTAVAGLMASSDAVADRVLAAAEAAGERFWQLPITDQARKMLPSTVADLQSKAYRNGSTLFAAAFLQHFVGKQTAWAHLDIAGPAWNSSPAHDYVPSHATGMGVRTLVSLAQSLAR